MVNDNGIAKELFDGKSTRAFYCANRNGKYSIMKELQDRSSPQEIACCVLNLENYLGQYIERLSINKAVKMCNTGNKYVFVEKKQSFIFKKAFK